MMKTVFVILFAFLLFHDALSQTENNEYLPASPTAAALSKYIDIPVDMASGIPTISIPIYDVTAGGLTLPISLSYHAGGFKVEEESSWVGLGWSLNAGGVISRSIRHLMDDATSGTRHEFFDTYAGTGLSETNPIDYSNLTILAEGSNVIDGSPDVYSYNFGGYSGKFIYLNEVKLLPKKPVLITKISTG